MRELKVRETLVLKLQQLTLERDQMQQKLCALMSQIEATRQQLRDIGYTHSSAVMNA